MDDASKVLAALYDRGDAYGAVRELAVAAGVDEARFRSAIEALKARGVAVEQNPAHGLRLIRPAPLDSHLIERDLPIRRIGRHAIVFDEVDSTNDVAAASARQADADGLVVLAEHQRRGRGRLDRVWLSPTGQNILMSVLLIEPSDRLPQEAVTVATGLAVAEGIEGACAGAACHLRWPNDVLLDGGKVAGVLTERRRSAGQACWVLGVGINANAAPPADAVDRPATFLAAHTGEAVDRTAVVRSVLVRLDAWIDRVAQGELGSLHEAWVARCDMINQRVTVLCGERTIVGRVLDVGPLEGLILMCDDGRREHVPADGATLLD